MDSLITAAAQALAAGDPLAALNRVALRNDAAALALRGIAMAQMGELERAKVLLRKAARAFSAKEAVARARCVVAEAEIALVSRELSWATGPLAEARATLEEHHDWLNAAHAGHLEARRLLLIGQVDEAEQLLGTLDTSRSTPAVRAAYDLVVAGIAIRKLRIAVASEALDRAERSARASGIPALVAEVERARSFLTTPAARVIERGNERPVLLEEVESLFTSEKLIVDACRRSVRSGSVEISLAARPVLFSLLRALAEAWPADATREDLLRRAFGAKTADESHRARLRVEVGRLRVELRKIAEIKATNRGFLLVPRAKHDVVVLAPPVDGEHAAVLALLGDGETWSSSALAIALGASARTIQRALENLVAADKVQALGQGRARRWFSTSLNWFPTTLLLPGPLPSA